MTEYDQEIRITPPQGTTGGWRATREVPQAWADLRVAGMPSVSGGAEGYSAFIDAWGGTATEAVENLYLLIGKAFLVAEWVRVLRIMPGQQPRDIKRTFEVTLEEATELVSALFYLETIEPASRQTRMRLLARVMGDLVEFTKEAEAKRSGRAGEP